MLSSKFNLRAWLQAILYDRAMRSVEKHCLARWRQELLSPLRGDVLEIGSGTGINLEYYAQLDRLVLSEPDAHMRRQLQKRLLHSHRTHVEVLPCCAERIELPDASFDHIVSTLVLCSVTGIHEALQEARRLLRPGGSLVLIEHVRAEGDPSLYHWQQRLEPFWKWFAGNCHLTRQTELILKQVGFKPKLQRVDMQGAPPFVRPVIKGQVFRPGEEG